jgi:hypothetical protein
MYNLIISGAPDAWLGPHFDLPQDRFLEHTSDDVRQRFEPLDARAIEELRRLPTVFAHERDVELPARVGWITDLRVRQHVIRIRFQFDQAIEPFSTNDLDAHVWEFDVNRLETYRTHWAVKDVDLFEALAESGVGGVLARPEGANLPPYVEIAGDAAPIAQPIARTEIAPLVFRVPEGGIENDLVGVMMPFAHEFDSTHNTILAACQEAELRGLRADNIWEDEAVIQDVFSLIYRSKLVVVDYTGKNPNVFYETGIAHTLGKPVVPITQNEEDVPFDLRHNRYLRYETTEDGLAELQTKLAARFRTLR